jgi:hypothetical protein
MQLRASAVADNEGMQLRVEALTARVQELERALQDAQRITSTPNDPMVEDSQSSLPSPEPSSVGNGSDRESQDSYGERCSSYPHLHFPTRFIGTLYLGAAGDARFFGPTARSDYLAYVCDADFTPFHQVECMGYHQAANTDKSFAPIFPNISKTIVDAATFHDTIPTRNPDEVRRQLLGFLPTREDAEHLCNLYLEYGRHMYVLLCHLNQFLTPYLDGTASRGRNFARKCWALYMTSKCSTPHQAHNF